ncbi:MAG: condensation domain-containing protein, partial [Cyanobacteria bacterium J06627_28]
MARRSRPDKLPLSASQQHLWILHQLYPDTCAYHIALSLRIRGDLSVVALRQSLQRIVNRHDSLRTVFVKADNQPWLKVLPQVELALPIVDLSTEENPYSVVEHWRQTLVQTPFNLETGPLIRAQLLRLDTQAFELILVLHHLIADGWSRGILLRELAAYYRHMNASQVAMSQTELESVLPALSFHYADYLLQQQQWLASNASQQQLDYWKNQLADITPLALPHTGEAGTDFSSQICTRSFSIEQTQAIKALAKQAGTTVFTVLLTIFKLLLHRYSRQADIAVGVPVAGRSSVATEVLIGFFVNTLVLRSQVDSDSTFTDWLKQVQATLADALQHQDVPFAKVVDAVGAQRIPGQNPLFRVMFQVQSGGYELQNAQQLDLDLPGLTLTQQWIAPSETKFDMSWHVIERDEALLVAVEYRASMFEGDRIKSMLSHFQTLVDTVVTSPNRVLSDFSLLSDSEKEQILTEWSQGKSVECSNDGFPARFEQQVEKTPQAIAVSDRANNLSLSYQQLNQRANKLAHWLRSQGIGTDRLVALCLPHGIDLMTALIATLKSGAAYIPIDPALPPERVQYMLQDARANLGWLWHLAACTALFLAA